MAIVFDSDAGTITGLSVGGLPDGVVDSGTIATGTIVDADVNDLAASKLTGALPAISGASLTGVGVAGISSSADATAMTITSAEKIGIGTTSPDSIVEIEGASPILTITDTDASGANSGLWIRELGSHNMPADSSAYGAFLNYNMANNKLHLTMRSGTTTTEALTIERDTGAVGINVDGFATTAAANGWTQPLQIKYTETSISSTGWHHIDLNRQATNGAGSIGCGVPIGFIPGKEYNANMTVDKIGVTPWPDGSNRYEYKVYVTVTTAGTLGIFYLFGG